LISYEEQNEPGLLKRLADESTKVSWAWRNPPPKPPRPSRRFA
jgi:hypothetical protein